MENQNNRGQAIIVNLLIFAMIMAVLVAMIPAMNAMLGIAQQSNELNCPGYYVAGDPNATLSYNSSLATNTLACIGIQLYLPYMVLVILIGGVTRLIGGRMFGGGDVTTG